MNDSVQVFNNEIEIGLRILIVLNTTHPRPLDIEFINYYDYFSLHTGDIGGGESLHAPVPNRFGELSVKRELLLRSLNYLLLKGLVKQVFAANGVEYMASESTAPFIDTLNEDYTLKFIENVKWVFEKFGDYTPRRIREYIRANQEQWGSELSFCSVGFINE